MSNKIEEQHTDNPDYLTVKTPYGNEVQIEDEGQAAVAEVLYNNQGDELSPDKVLEEVESQFGLDEDINTINSYLFKLQQLGVVTEVGEESGEDWNYSWGYDGEQAEADPEILEKTDEALQKTKGSLAPAL